MFFAIFCRDFLLSLLPGNVKLCFLCEIVNIINMLTYTYFGLIKLNTGTTSASSVTTDHFDFISSVQIESILVQLTESLFLHFWHFCFSFD